MAEIGNALNSYLTIVASARDAARLYSQGGATDASLVAAIDRETERLDSNVDTSSLDHCDASELGVCKTTSGTPPASDAMVSVRVCYDHPLIIGIPMLFEGPLRMCSTTVMRVAQ
jgi:hypothetical protein